MKRSVDFVMLEVFPTHMSGRNSKTIFSILDAVLRPIEKL